MPSPFPGVDLYLENSEFYPEFHHRLITVIAHAIAPSVYRSLLNPGDCRPIAHLFTLTIREGIPSFPLPFQQGGWAISVELQALLTGINDRAGFDLAVDYN